MSSPIKDKGRNIMKHTNKMMGVISIAVLICVIFVGPLNMVSNVNGRFF